MVIGLRPLSRHSPQLVTRLAMVAFGTDSYYIAHVKVQRPCHFLGLRYSLQNRHRCNALTKCPVTGSAAFSAAHSHILTFLHSHMRCHVLFRCTFLCFDQIFFNCVVWRIMREVSSLEARGRSAPGTRQQAVAQQINLWRLRDKDCVPPSFAFPCPSQTYDIIK